MDRYERAFFYILYLVSKSVRIIRYGISTLAMDGCRKAIENWLVCKASLYMDFSCFHLNVDDNDG